VARPSEVAFGGRFATAFLTLFPPIDFINNIGDFDNFPLLTVGDMTDAWDFLANGDIETRDFLRGDIAGGHFDSFDTWDFTISGDFISAGEHFVLPRDVVKEGDFIIALAFEEPARAFRMGGGDVEDGPSLGTETFATTVLFIGPADELLLADGTFAIDDRGLPGPCFFVVGDPP